jgi:hypothetical protein
MCYFDQTRWTCGYWKWGNFKQQCTKEYRTGETCGLKLVFETHVQPTQCKICDQIEKKERRWTKMSSDVDRWRNESNRSATIEKTERDMNELRVQIQKLWTDHYTRQQRVS